MTREALTVNIKGV